MSKDGIEKVYESVKRYIYYNPENHNTEPLTGKNLYYDLRDFHIPIERMHNSNLHDWGIASGLEVSGKIDDIEIKVNSGVAIDSSGLLISLKNKGYAYIGEMPPVGEDFALINVGNNKVEVPVLLRIDDSHAGKTFYVTIQFSQILSSEPASMLGRWEQLPWVRLQPVEDFDGKAIVLAIAVISKDGKLAQLVANPAELKEMANHSLYSRLLIGQSLKELQIQRSSNVENKVDDMISGKIGPGDAGGLKITVPDAQDSILFTREGGSDFANLEIRANVRIGISPTDTISERLEVNGTLKATEFKGKGLLIEDPEGKTKWHINQNLDGDKNGLNFAETDVADGNGRLFIEAGGNVGIGTDEPKAKLHVKEGGIKWGNNSQLNKDQGGSIDLGGDSQTEGEGTPHIDFHYKGLKEDYNTRIINDDDGKLSINAKTLHVSDNLDIGKSGQNESSNIRLQGKNAFQVYDNYLRINQKGDFLATQFDYRANFYRGLTTGNYNVDPGVGNLLVDGNVGIGIPSPSEKLEVNGKVKATYFQGDGSDITGIHKNINDIPKVDLDPISNEDYRDKHISNALAKSWQDHIKNTKRNPHKVTANDVGALPNKGGTIDGYLIVNGDISGNGNLLFESKNTNEKKNLRLILGHDYTLETHDLVCDYEFMVGHERFFPLYNKRLFFRIFSINKKGDLYCAGSKAGYLIDYFINKVGDTLEQGDVVVLSKHQVLQYSGTNNNIPIPEVNLTDKAYDTSVCGIVTEVVTEEDLPHVEIGNEIILRKEGIEKEKQEDNQFIHPLHKYAAKISKAQDPKKVMDQQMGKMATLGAFAHCKVDADIAPIKAGDLLTTCSTKGHAQKVIDREKATGSIIGKALGSLEKGKDEIPIMVMLQ